MDSKRSGGDPGAGDASKVSRGTDRRATGDRRKKDVGPPKGADDRRLAERRTGLDRRRPHLHYEDLTPHPRPERNINDYPLSTDEVEFINAINDYKQKFNRPFPTWSEVLHVLRTLGYLRVDEPFPVPSTGGPFDPKGGVPPESAPEGGGTD
jgi:hypothetical protein